MPHDLCVCFLHLLCAVFMHPRTAAMAYDRNLVCSGHSDAARCNKDTKNRCMYWNKSCVGADAYEVGLDHGWGLSCCGAVRYYTMLWRCCTVPCAVPCHAPGTLMLKVVLCWITPPATSCHEGWTVAWPAQRNRTAKGSTAAGLWGDGQYSCRSKVCIQVVMVFPAPIWLAAWANHSTLAGLERCTLTARPLLPC